MKIAIVIPCHRVRAHILKVLAGIGPEAARIYVVDDRCPEQSGELVRAECRDPRVDVLFNPRNLGVGGAVIAGYHRALADGADVVVKLDGDGQMDATAVSRLIEPIRRGAADYCKGNRFYHPIGLKDMPPARLLGNAALSFVNKLVNGYWQVMDPTNGFTAIHTAVLRLLPLDQLDNGYFFESDMLFRLSTVRATVTDIPMEVRYGSEHSGLSVWRSLLGFPLKYGIRIFKRIVYNYYLRDFNAGSLELPVGLGLAAFGTAFGLRRWIVGTKIGVLASTGTVMLAALPVILGAQLLLAFVQYDLANVPTQAIHPLLPAGGQGNG